MKTDTIFNIRRIFFVLGTACNFNCVYCVQHENKPRCKKLIKQDVIDWLADIAYQMPLRLKPEICFYGGEPLLYRESMRQIVDRFGEDFNYIIFSNGSNLTELDVDWINNHQIKFVLSNDGRNTIATRGFNMLEDQEFVEKFKRIKKKQILLVHSAASLNLDKEFEYIENKVPGIEIYAEDLMCNSTTPKELVEFDPQSLWDSYQNMFNQFLNKANTNAARRYGGYMMRAHKCITIEKEFPDYGTCGSGKHVISVDTDGNVYLCKNFNVKIGTVKTPYPELTQKAKEITKQLRDENLKNKGCFECGVFYFCRGGCPFEKSSDLQKKKCDMLRIKWSNVIEHYERG